MEKSEKGFAVFYKNEIMESIPSGQLLIFKARKYAEGSIWNNVTRFCVRKDIKLSTPKLPNYKITELNRKFAKKYSVKSVTIAYEVKDE
jgi:hypothetical protein